MYFEDITGLKPIYEIVMGNPTRDVNTMGFYYDKQDAIDAMHENRADIREYAYDDGYVLIRYPGLYNPVLKEDKIYFVWDAEREGFFEAEEPKEYGSWAL